DLVGDQGVAQVAAYVEAVDEQYLELLDLGLAQLLELVDRDLFVDRDQHLAGLFVDDVLGADLAGDLDRIDRQAIELRFLELADRGASELAVLAHDYFRADLDVARRALSR